MWSKYPNSRDLRSTVAPRRQRADTSVKPLAFWLETDGAVRVDVRVDRETVWLTHTADGRGIGHYMPENALMHPRKVFSSKESAAEAHYKGLLE